MASLNLSINGPSIKSSYQSVINGPPPNSSSPTYAQWALFSVQAPLANAFQDSGAKESVLKVQSTGDGELSDLIEDFNEGRIQFAFVKVKDPNSGLPKNALIAWCGGGVPERTKGYFTTHTAAVSKILHGYHVQITARSESDLEPESVMRKIADASGAKYSAGSSTPSAAPPPVASKPVFTPTSSSIGNVNPIVAARNRKTVNADDDGWGADAPPVTRSQLEKVESAYKPTKVNMAELTKQRQEPSSSNGNSSQDRPDVVRGAYQPVGKVDIAAIRAAAKNQNDDRPAPVKGAYEPVGKVDIAAIRAKAQKPSEPVEQQEAADDERPKSLAERSAAFNQSQSERLTSLPKPKVANKFGGAAAFTGTKAPAPGGIGFGAPSVPAPPPVGAASRTFADQGGKTPAQLWAEKKGKQGGSVSNVVSPPATSPIGVQKSGEWKSGYAGRSWGPVKTAEYGRGQISQENTGEDPQQRDTETPTSPGGGVGALRDRFKNAAPIAVGAGVGAGVGAAAGAAAFSREQPQEEEDEPSPPPPPSSDSRPPPPGGFALPGLPSRQAAEEEEEEEEEQEPQSPIRVAQPVARGHEVEIERPAEREPPRPIPTQEIEQELPREEDLSEEPNDVGRGAAAAVAEQQFGQEQVAAGQASSGGKRALIQYDYEKAEENELELREGEYVTNIEMVDEDWWMGTNSQGESGLFPSNYVELVGDEPEPAPAARSAPPPAPAQAEPAQAPAPAGAGAGQTATAQFDYEAAEDNELSFPENATITDLEFPDEDWWFGSYGGKQGLFPANYVQLDN
ncbi:Putative SH3 domain, actin-depolymerizing factor domain, ADF-H/Gelsolin-like domain superfamily [Colletotrichum destructivum]|uniref:SH3 domain, actin-depolymerizing factor domain, ADF-H/Gelsolin-like domain superfamily n=1 Tax=Colletotrichum destructivum TaxID=34406 RepID=A0AAX4I396_9PEZI|nr:Putative SH3 domain, actin-depolymerizing factor domain, ADF-H/Gelsolin-like domain superfamily [Colletotrichum destructivum]